MSTIGCPAAIAIKISNLLICFFDLFCPILVKGFFYQKCVYCLVLLNSILF